MNWVEIYNKLFKLIGRGSNYFSGPDFISLLQEIRPDFPDYGKYLEQRNATGQSTARKDYFKDIFLSLDDTEKADFAKRIVKETYVDDLARARDLDLALGGETVIPSDFVAPDARDLLGNFASLFETKSPVNEAKRVNSREMTDPKTVFVVHGRNTKARKALFQFLRSIGLHPLEWAQVIEKTGKASPYVGEILERGFAEAQAAIVLFTPDDEAQLKEEFRGKNEPAYETELTGQARPNVIFEAGMAMGLYVERTVLIEMGELRPISDISGRHVIKMNNSVTRRQELANRLKTAGCTINLVGTDWHEEGNFEPFPSKKNITVPKINPVIASKNKEQESIETRLDRILKIEKLLETYGSIQLDNLDGVIRTEYRQGKFRLYEQRIGSEKLGFYIALPSRLEMEIDFDRELADVRVLLEANSQIAELRFTFVIVSRNDESLSREGVLTAFEKTKTFVRLKSPLNFTLEIWDEKEILRKEQELGIKLRS